MIVLSLGKCRETIRDQKIRIKRERIFGELNHSTYLGFWRVLRYNGKHLCHKRNTLNFEGGGSSNIIVCGDE